MSAWVLVADQMGYDDHDMLLGVFLTRDDAFAALVGYLQDALAEHPSNRALLDDHFSVTQWDGMVEGECWQKRGEREWRRVEEVQG